MATALVHGPETVEAIKKVRAFAEDPAYWRHIGDDQVIQVPGDITAYTVELPVGFKAVYSIDVVEGKAYRHLSVSLYGVDDQPKGIHPVVMSEIMGLYDFGDDAQVGTTPGDPPWVVHALEDY